MEPSEIYQGEAVTLTLKIPGFKAGMTPDLGSIPATAVTLLGQTDQNVQSITIINGQRQVTGFSGRIFQYRVTPTDPGTYALGPIHIHVDSRRISVPGPHVTVNPVPLQDAVLIRFEPSKSTVVIEEAFDITVRLLIRRLPAPHADASPIPDQAPPQLTLPFLGNSATEGLESSRIEDILNPLLIPAGEGFHINGFTLGDDDVFGSLFAPRRPRHARFRLERHDVQHDGHAYYEYRFPMRYVPLREGGFRFDPVIFRGDIFTAVTPRGEGVTERIYAVSDAITVHAAPPPSETRPSTYIGAVGTHPVVTAMLDTRTCFVGDPLTLEIQIGGNIRLHNIVAPRLGTQPDLHRDFRIYEDTVQRQTTDTGRLYRFIVRPSRAGTLEFPPVAISYYDTHAADYRTVTTLPIPVRANTVSEIQGEFVIRSDERRITITDAPERAVPAPIRVPADPDVTQPFFMLHLHLPLLAAGPLLAFIVWLTGFTRRHVPSISRSSMRRRAAATACKQIAAAADNTTPHREIADALRTYLRIQFDDRVRATTPSECVTLLTTGGVNSALAEKFAHCLETCTAATFTTRPDLPPVDILETIRMIRALDNALRPRWRFRLWIPRAAAASLATACLLMPGNADASADAIIQFEAQRAVSALMRASRPEDFAAAADSFARLIEQGGGNTDLYYNHGTALLLAGNPTAALDAFARAERHGGTAWDIRRNMALALRALNNDEPTPLPWQRVPLFWHYGLPISARMTLAAWAFFLTWLLPWLHRTRLHAFAVPATGIAAALTLLLTASVLSSLYSEHRGQQHTTPLSAPAGAPHHDH